MYVGEKIHHFFKAFYENFRKSKNKRKKWMENKNIVKSIFNFICYFKSNLFILNH